ncbi:MULTISPECIES: hypothetical protein [unclassified Lysobacter]|uniref:hypothetical protein n=1 Tax=unclassified Lysobacter TaxID=2635362 RepID=UPI001BE5ADE7|nr:MULTISPECIES: hypothetical protein [unclassified Lysobacter]MBT2747656.1 hypothetical protein [Lysobacter sp. ISL-42]MBT2752863.1 hypothetical protein [Lysobacter sp. ISL-50]MBT2779747.1 hypothetical protein [Lysobacter sp. ISL-54]MBT2784561.1 hypothetical protein [Lysobacter sp. ISL-52]
MARYPRIDQPCPLDTQARLRIDGHCGLCGKTVHCLDGRSDAERAALLRQASGPICVSYRLALGTALALSVVAPTAAGPTDAAAPATPSQTAPLTAPNAASQAQSPVAPETLADPGLVSIFVGGISRPDEAEWVEDDRDLPELPMRREPPPRE